MSSWPEEAAAPPKGPTPTKARAAQGAPSARPQAGTSGSCGTGGGGGTNNQGGAGGTGATSGSAGVLGLGGAGGHNTSDGGGGGGGYYGGGGGAACGSAASGGGGGGSDYVEASATSVQDYPGYNAGDGSVTVTYPPSSSSSPPGNGTKGFSYNGAPQLWTVPAGVTSVQVDVRGAEGRYLRRAGQPGGGHCLGRPWPDNGGGRGRPTLRQQQDRLQRRC